jgi:protein-S-isoprenylcysteine O-methyltransferase Ste14
MFRWIALIILGSALAVSGWHRARARLRGGQIPRTREGVPLKVGRALGAVLVFGSVLAYIVNPEWMSWAAFDAAPWLRWTGAGLGVVAVLAVHWVLRTLGDNVSETVLTKDGQELVTHGPYRWVRHPLYTTGIALLVALGLIAANWLVLAATVVVGLTIRCWIIPAEEAALLARFGEDYARYRRTTGALIPRTRKARVLGFRVVVTLATASWVGCVLLTGGCRKEPDPATQPAAGPVILKIAVLADGRLLADGTPTSLESLRERLGRVKAQHGVVWYYREGSDGEPPPIAMEVMSAVVDAGLPIRLSSRPDYSDAVDAGGSPDSE